MARRVVRCWSKRMMKLSLSRMACFGVSTNYSLSGILNQINRLLDILFLRSIVRNGRKNGCLHGRTRHPWKNKYTVRDRWKDGRPVHIERTTEVHIGERMSGKIRERVGRIDVWRKGTIGRKNRLHTCRKRRRGIDNTKINEGKQTDTRINACMYLDGMHASMKE